MSDDTLTPEQRAEQRATWRKAIAKANAVARTGRARRNPPATKAGMHRLSATRGDGTT